MSITLRSLREHLQKAIDTIVGDNALHAEAVLTSIADAERRSCERNEARISVNNDNYRVLKDLSVSVSKLADELACNTETIGHWADNVGQMAGELRALRTVINELAAGQRYNTEALLRLTQAPVLDPDPPPVRPDKNPLLAPFGTLNKFSQDWEWDRYRVELDKWRQRHPLVEAF